MVSKNSKVIQLLDKKNWYFLNEKNIVHSIGIPTGPEFNVITSDIINLIDKCFNNIYLFIKK